MNSPQSFHLIGYAYGSAANTPGGDEAPRVLRSLKLKEKIERLGHSVTDLGDTSQECTPSDQEYIAQTRSAEEASVHNLSATYLACRSLAEKTAHALASGGIPLIVGGDHSLSIGSVAAVSNYYAARGQKVGLIWVDTHADINTPATSPSQNIFGMSAACLLGMIPGLLQSLQNKPAIDPEKLVYIGLRDLDPGEKIYLREKNIRAYSMKEIDMLGLGEVTKQAMAHVGQDTAGYVVSFDLDVCDPQLVPGTGTPVRGGLTFREAHLLLELIAEDKRMLSLEMVELNPLLDQNFTTADLAISLIESALGKSILR